MITPGISVLSERVDAGVLPLSGGSQAAGHTLTAGTDLKNGSVMPQMSIYLN
jgi:hypothetical protein